MKTSTLSCCGASLLLAVFLLQAAFAQTPAVPNNPVRPLAPTTPAPGTPAVPAAPAAPKPVASSSDVADRAAINVLVVEVAAQQKQMVMNQDEIEKKLAILQEEIRQARILAKRGGGSGAP